MKKVVAILLSVILLTATVAVNANALTEEEANAGYYLVGSMTDWNIDSAYRFDMNPADQNEYMIKEFPLTTSDEFKVVYSPDGLTIGEFIPDGFDTNCTLKKMGINADSVVDIYFRPDMDGDDQWYFGCIFIEFKENSPTEIPTSPDPNDKYNAGYYLVNGRNNYAIDKNLKLNRNPFSNSLSNMWIHDVTLSTSDRIRIAYSTDGETISKLYPKDDDYIPEYNSRYYTVEFESLGDSEGDEWFMGTIKAYPCEPPWGDDPQPVEGEGFSVNRYEDKFYAAYPSAEDDVDYQELYVHYGNWTPDWVLVQTSTLTEGVFYGVFDDVVVCSSQDYPFKFGCGVYDVKADAFYDITQAWNMGYADLHDAFVNYATNFTGADLLGDADMDGELSIIDVTYIQRYLVGMIDLDDCSEMFEHMGCSFGTELTSLADYDDNGDVEIVDATRIQRALIGIPLYPHSFTAIAVPEKKSDGWYIHVGTAFGDEPVSYRYDIQGGFHADSVYGDDWGDFDYYDPDYEPIPGDFYKTTGTIQKDCVKLPLNSLTYDDWYDLTVTVKDASGNTAEVNWWFNNTY